MSTGNPYSHFLQACRRNPPRVAIVLGSGQEDAAAPLQCTEHVSFGDVPDLVAPTVQGHKGEMRLGSWCARRVLIFFGRLHYYEGHPWRRVEQQVPIARELGAEILLLTNAAGGIRPDLGPGKVMPIADHIEWTRGFPLEDKGPGTRPSPYSARLLDILVRVAAEITSPTKAGNYAQVTGPCYETPAEIRALQSCGADVVGMSTCREINRAHSLGMECAAFSCVTNRAAGLSAAPIHHEEVLEAGKANRGVLARLVEGFLMNV